MKKCEEVDNVLDKKESEVWVSRTCHGNSIDNVRHRNLFLYIEDTIEFFEQSGVEISVELTYEIEKMYLKDDYSESTEKHKNILEDILYVAKMALECFGLYGGIVEDLEHMIDCM